MAHLITWIALFISVFTLTSMVWSSLIESLSNDGAIGVDETTITYNDVG